MSGGQHRVDEVTRTESRGLDRKNNPRIAAHRPPEETAGLRNAGVCAKGIKKESNTLDVADFVRDVAKSASHQLSQNEISSDNPLRQLYWVAILVLTPSLGERRLDSQTLRSCSRRASICVLASSKL